MTCECDSTSFRLLRVFSSLTSLSDRPQYVCSIYSEYSLRTSAVIAALLFCSCSLTSVLFCSLLSVSPSVSLSVDGRSVGRSNEFCSPHGTRLNCSFFRRWRAARRAGRGGADSQLPDSDWSGWQSNSLGSRTRSLGLPRPAMPSSPQPSPSPALARPRRRGARSPSPRSPDADSGPCHGTPEGRHKNRMEWTLWETTPKIIPRFILTFRAKEKRLQRLHGSN